MLLNRIINDFTGLLPCTEQEITEFEKRNNLLLPKIYRDIVLLSGHSMGKLIPGSYLLFEDLDGIKNDAIEKLTKNKADFALTENDLVFLNHGGYQFLFIRLDEGDPYPVYIYDECEDEKGFKRLYDSLETFFDKQITQRKW